MSAGIRRGMTTLAVFATLAAATCATAPTAQAAPSTGSLTIVAEHNTATTTVMIKNAVFTISRVTDLDLNTNAGVARFNRYQLDPADGHFQYDQALQLAATDSGGTTSVTSLSLGAYKVHELGVIDSAGIDAKLRTIDDFLVALPTGGPNGTSEYDVTVMPKEDGDLGGTQQGNGGSGESNPTPGGNATSGNGTSTNGNSGSSGTSGSSACANCPDGCDCSAYTDGSDGDSGTNRTSINSGDGADFTGTTQYLTIAGGVALVLAAFGVTRRRRRESEE